MNNRWTRWLAIAAVALSIVALVFLAFYPCTIQSVSTRTRVEGGPNLQAPIVESECFSLLESQGLGILAVLSIPVGLTLLGVAGVFSTSLSWAPRRLCDQSASSSSSGPAALTWKGGSFPHCRSDGYLPGFLRPTSGSRQSGGRPYRLR